MYLGTTGWVGGNGTPDLIGFTAFGKGLGFADFNSTFPIPVTFGVPGVITAFGHGQCQTYDFWGCTGVTSFVSYVSNVTFSDAQGNPLTGVSLVPLNSAGREEGDFEPTPEPSAVLLLGTALLVMALWRGLRWSKTLQRRSQLVPNQTASAHLDMFQTLSSVD